VVKPISFKSIFLPAHLDSYDLNKRVKKTLRHLALVSDSQTNDLIFPPNVKEMELQI